MISDFDGSLESRYFLNVIAKCFALCACAFESSGLITYLECTPDQRVTYAVVVVE